MKQKIHLLYCLVLLFLLFNDKALWAQSFMLENEIKVKATDVAVDNLGKIVAINRDEILQFSPEGKLANRYSNLKLGEIGSIDITNPLKIVVFYQHQAQVVFLDNTLSMQTEQIALETFGYDQAALVCSSVNNGIWLFDQRSFQLIRLSEKLEEIQKTVNISQIIGKEINPKFMVERNNWVYLSDPDFGILVFDIYGTYLKTIPEKGVQQFQVADHYIYFQENNALTRYDLKQNLKETIPLPYPENRGIWIEKKKIFILTEESLKIYTIKM